MVHRFVLILVVVTLASKRHKQTKGKGELKNIVVFFSLFYLHFFWYLYRTPLLPLLFSNIFNTCFVESHRNVSVIYFPFADWQSGVCCFRRNDTYGDMPFASMTVTWYTKRTLSGNVERAVATLLVFPLLFFPRLALLKVNFQSCNFFSKEFYFFQYNNRHIHHCQISCIF